MRIAVLQRLRRCNTQSWFLERQPFQKPTFIMRIAVIKSVNEIQNTKSYRVRYSFLGEFHKEFKFEFIAKYYNL